MSDQPFKLQGINFILNKMNAVAEEPKRKSGRFALRKAAQIVASSAQRGAAAIDDPNTANSIAKNIAIRWDGKRFRKTGDMVFRVGVRGGAKNYAATKGNVRKGRAGKSYATGGSKLNPGGDTFYWRFIEFGTSSIRAQPFMRTALSTNIERATTEFTNHFERALDRAILRAEKGGR